ncbi:hypothetical protein G4O51_12195 [Candidatus Bathyarchaeota archaeon A05DMB-2]|jgi:hypothetical protein|nr:hypothetical protein [Candidatus Bathyarchaeota archaeon A05DMB-2]
MMARKITSNYDVIGICFENTPVARSQAQKAKGDLGINLGISSDSAFDDIYFYAYGSTVMMAFYPSDLNKKVTKIFQSYNALEEVPKVEFEEILEARNPVKFTYMINEDWASLWHQKAKRMLENASYP